MRPMVGMDSLGAEILGDAYTDARDRVDRLMSATGNVTATVDARNKLDDIYQKAIASGDKGKPAATAAIVAMNNLADSIEASSKPSFLITDTPSTAGKVVLPSDGKPAPGWSQPQPQAQGPSTVPAVDAKPINFMTYAAPVGISAIIGGVLGALISDQRGLGALAGASLGGAASFGAKFAMDKVRP